MQQALDHTKRTYTVEEFIRDFEGREGKAELVDGKVVWVFGPYDDGPGPEVINKTFDHASAKLNLAIALRTAVGLVGAPLVVISDGMSARTGSATLRGPDAAVIRRDQLALSKREIVQPVILCEVLSPSTWHTDTGSKVGEYFGLPTLSHYVVVDPSARTAMVYRRTEGEPEATTFSEGNVVLSDVPPTGARLVFPLASLWVV